MNLLDPDLYRRCLSHHVEVRKLDFVVSNSLPIPYFGDLAAFLKSPLRVLTAALNPSDQEFLPSSPRFDVAKGQQGSAELEAELSAYFRSNPYRRWFRSFEPVLNGLGVSYGGVMSDGKYCSTALHVDMCSPIATLPTWSRLTLEQRARLTETGRDVFERLVDELEPDIIVASLGWGHIEGWHADFQAGRSWPRIVEHWTDKKGKPLISPLIVQCDAIKSRKGRPFLFANGTAAERPFGRFSMERQREVGEVLRQRLP